MLAGLGCLLFWVEGSEFVSIRALGSDVVSFPVRGCGFTSFQVLGVMYVI